MKPIILSLFVSFFLFHSTYAASQPSVSGISATLNSKGVKYHDFYFKKFNLIQSDRQYYTFGNRVNNDDRGQQHFVPKSVRGLIQKLKRESRHGAKFHSSTPNTDMAHLQIGGNSEQPVEYLLTAKT